MGKITLILGGARSGKSTYALSLAKKYKKVAFIATCAGLDKEMRERINKHKETRPVHWNTFEETKDLAPLLNKIGDSFGCILIDCLTLLVSNLILNGEREDRIIKKIDGLLAILRKRKARVIFVSNEVGLGIVPDNKLARDFRDVAGKVNQMVASASDEVFLMISGMPLKIKGKQKWIK